MDVVTTFFTGLVASIGIDHAGVSMDAQIRALPEEKRISIVERYSWAGLVFSKFLKFRQPAAIYLLCPVKGCDTLPLRILEDLRSRAPTAIGKRVVEKAAAQIEIHVAPEAAGFEARDREIDAKLHLNANITMKRFLEPQPATDAPCWTITYFDNSGVVAKSLIFIDSDASPRMQYLCMGFETVRALGVMNLESVYFYRDLEKEPFGDPVQWLAAMAFLHGLPDIRPGDAMERARAILEDRYELR